MNTAAVGPSKGSLEEETMRLTADFPPTQGTWRQWTKSGHAPPSPPPLLAQLCCQGTSSPSSYSLNLVFLCFQADNSTTYELTMKDILLESWKIFKANWVIGPFWPKNIPMFATVASCTPLFQYALHHSSSSQLLPTLACECLAGSPTIPILCTISPKHT